MGRSARGKRFLDDQDVKNQYLGKPRKHWAHAAAMSLMTSQTAEGRFLLLRGGFLKFQKAAAPAFKTFVGLHFTNHEVRWIFDTLMKWAKQLGETAHWDDFERKLQQQKFNEPFRPSPEKDPVGDDIEVTKIRDGFMRRVH